jgi:hypothetical protein
MSTARWTLGTALLLTGLGGAAQAETLEQRLARMEARLAEMQQRLTTQEARIASQDALIASQQARLEQAGPAAPEAADPAADPAAEPAGGPVAAPWHERLELAGLVEVAASHRDPFTGAAEDDLVLATFELAISAQLSDWVEVGASLLYEEDDTPLELDTAFIAFANPRVRPLFVTVGQFYLPFGAYDTALVSDPLTLELGEARETALQLGLAGETLLGSLYLFNGDAPGSDRLDTWGAALDYAAEADGGSWSLGLGYHADLGESDGLQDLIAAGPEGSGRRVPAWTAHGTVRLGPFQLLGEYLAATRRFAPGALSWGAGGARPAAWNLEAGWDFDLLGRGATLALAWQGTREALALELPRERWLLGLSVALPERTALSLEWARDRDYGSGDGGTGRDADTLTAQVAVEF